MGDESDPMEELTLNDYLALLRRRWKTITATTLAVMLGALAVTAARGNPAPLVAEPSAQLLPEARLLLGPSLDKNGNLVEPQPSTAAEILRSEQIANRAGEAIGWDDSDALLADLTVTAETEVLVISHPGTEDIGGDEVTEAFALAFLDFQQREVAETQRNQLVDLKAALEGENERLEEQLSQLVKIDYPDERSAGSAIVAAIAGSNAQTIGLTEKLTNVESFDTEDVGQLLGVTSTATSATAATADPAVEVPATSTSTSKPWARNGVAGLIIGVIVGAFLVLLQEQLRGRFLSIRNVEQLLRLPVLAVAEERTADPRPFQKVALLFSKPSVASVALVGPGIDETDPYAAQLRQALTADNESAPTVIGIDDPLQSPKGLREAAAADKVVLLVDPNRVSKTTVSTTVEDLRRVGADLEGVLVIGKI